jgi:endonuclease/exonuclease/phosphatase family metal-dependent hydrolase
LNAIAILVVAAASRAFAQNDTLRVATFNINYANENLAAIAAAIDEAAPTIVCIQESNQQSERHFRSTFQKQFPHQHFVAHRGEYLEEGLAILSKVPLSDVRFVPPKSGLFGTYYATFNFSGMSVRIANVHLSPFLIRPGSGFRETYQSLQSSETIRKAEIQLIVEQVDADHATLICGDFNSLSWLVAPKRLVKERFIDSFASVTQNADLHATWRWPVDKPRLHARIDYIFHSNHFTTESSRIAKTNDSDHYLLVSTLKTRPNAQ